MPHNPQTALELAAKKARSFPPNYREARHLLAQRIRRATETADGGDGALLPTLD
jgi:hypothetical protein